jgi:hypothetical protein
MFFVVKYAVGSLANPTIWGYTAFNFVPKMFYHFFKFIAIVGLLRGASYWVRTSDEQRVNFGTQLFSFVILLEFLFVAEKLIKVLYFDLMPISYSVDDHRHFVPFLFSELRGDGLVQRFVMDYSPIHWLYLVGLAVGVRSFLKVSVGQSIYVVCVGYLVPSLLWSWLLFKIGF